MRYGASDRSRHEHDVKRNDVICFTLFTCLLTKFARTHVVSFDVFSRLAGRGGTARVLAPMGFMLMKTIHASCVLFILQFTYFVLKMGDAII